MKVFVAGATGVLGTRVVPLLIAAGHDVTAVARNEDKTSRLRAGGAAAVAVDLYDAAAVAAAVLGHDAVVNLATRIPPPSRMLLPGAWRENDRLRSQASANLARAAEAGGAQRFVQESIVLVYPDQGDAWITEDTPVDPPKGLASALAAERAAARFTAAGGAGVVLRFGLFYSADSAQSRPMVAAARRGRALTLGSPDGYVPSIASDDAAAAVVAGLALPAGVWNVVDDEPLTRREHFDALAEAVGRDSLRLPPAMPAPGRLSGQARSLRVSNARLRAAGQWTPRYPSVREGWQAVVDELEKAARHA